jgi:hypothetical protein
MPFRSEAQRRFMYSQHPRIAERWSREAERTGEAGKDLPEKITNSNPRVTFMRGILDAVKKKVRKERGKE